MRQRRTNEPGAQSRADQRSRLQRGGPYEMPPWAAESANDNARSTGSYLPSAQGNWEDDATTLYRRSEVTVRRAPRTHTRSIPPKPPQIALERISSMPDEPRFALEGSLARSMRPDAEPRPSRWRAVPGLIVLGVCAYFSGRALLWTAPLPYGGVPAPLAGISAEAHVHAAAAPQLPAAAAPMQMQAAVGTAVVDRASYTVVTAVPTEVFELPTEALPRTPAHRKQHVHRAGAGRRHAAVTRRIEPLREPVEVDEPEMVAPTPSEQGLLQVNSRPWARVLLDGRFVGHTPQLGLRVSPGKHHVLLVNEQMDMRKAFDVTVPAGATVSRVELLDDDTSAD